jgi:TM2 domain-containing membrane protein YozV
MPPPGYGPGWPPPAGYSPPPGYYGYVDPAAPFGRHPLTGEPYSDKQKLTAGLLELFLGHFGAGRWYLGDNGIALAQLLTCGGCGIWGLVDAIMMLTGNVRDKYGRPLRD